MNIKYIIFGAITIIVLLAIGYIILIFSGVSSMGNPTGGRGPNYPYFITKRPITVKKILVPIGTKLTFEEFLKEGEQEEIMNLAKLTHIELPKGKTINWGGVPVYMIIKFFNTEMQGYSVYANLDSLKDDKKTKFSALWQTCPSNLGVLVKDPDDWSFNPKNISDVSDCGVNYQRFFKEDKEQQQFLNELLSEMKKIN